MVQPTSKNKKRESAKESILESLASSVFTNPDVKVDDALDSFFQGLFVGFDALTYFCVKKMRGILDIYEEAMRELGLYENPQILAREYLKRK